MQPSNHFPIRNPTSADILLMIALAAVWASAFTAIKIAVPDSGPIWLVAMRASIGFLTLLPWALWKGWQWPASPAVWRQVITLSILNVGLPFFLISWGQSALPSSTAALLTGIGPIVSLAIAHFTSHDDKFNWIKALAVALGFSGVVLIVGIEAFSHMGGNLMAQAAVLIGAMCYVFSGVIMRRVVDFPPVRLSAIILGLAASLFLPLAFTLAGPLPSLSANAWIALIYLGIAPTGIAYILRVHLIRTVGVSFFSHVGNMIPLFGVFFGMVLLGEAVGWSTLAALTLILSGLAIGRLGSRVPVA